MFSIWWYFQKNFNVFCNIAVLLQTWMYLAVPMLLYACERLIRAFRSGYKSVRILKVNSKVQTPQIVKFICSDEAYILFCLYFRLLCTLEMYSPYICLNLKGLSTQVANTSLSTVQMSPHFNGKNRKKTIMSFSLISQS